MKRILAVVGILTIMASCSKKQSDDPGTSATPDKAVLGAPASNSTCIVGRIISGTQSGVLFSWNNANNATSYDLYIKNLLTGAISTQTAYTNQLEVTLLRNTPYSWYIVSKSSKTTETTQSDVWKFYNAGIAAVSYAPFPADVTLPALGQSVNAVGGKVTLSWTGADVDGDIIAYDVYLGTTSTNLAVVKADLVPATFDVSVTAGTNYYWKIVTKDSKGNTSISDIFQFKVN